MAQTAILNIPMHFEYLLVHVCTTYHMYNLFLLLASMLLAARLSHHAANSGTLHLPVLYDSGEVIVNGN